MLEILVSPTGKGVRISDSWGWGHYGAPRGKARHKGMDFICVPGQDVVAPRNGKIIRIARPYATRDYSGLLIECPGMTIKLFYLSPDIGLIGEQVKQYQVIGTAQDIGRKYAGMTPHIHMQLQYVDPVLLMYRYGG